MKPWAIGPPYGLSFFARSTSTWIHWWSLVASANWLTASWVTSYQSLVPSSWPTRLGSSAMVVVVVMPAILPARAAALSAGADDVHKPDLLARDAGREGLEGPGPLVGGLVDLLHRPELVGVPVVLDGPGEGLLLAVGV